MNKYYLYLLLLLILGSCNKDEIGSSQADYFIKFYGNVNADYAYDVKQTSDGGYILIGTTNADDTEDDIYIIKTNQYGNKKWELQIEDSLNDRGNKIIEHENSFYFVGTNQLKTDDYDIIVGNIDFSGNILWTKNIGGAGIQRGNSFIIDNNNDLVIVGSTNIASRINVGDTLPDNVNNAYFLKTDNNGDSITSTSLSGFDANQYDDYAQDVFLKPNGYYLFLINTKSSGEDKSYYKINLADYTSNLTISKNKIIDFNTESIAKSIILAEDNTIYLVGSIKINTNTTNIVVAKVAENLTDSIWTKKLGSSGTDIGRGIVEFSGGIAIVGTISSTESIGNGNNDIYFNKLDSEGNTLETYQAIGGTGNEEGMAISYTNDGGFVIVGTNSYDENADIAIIKTNSSGMLK